MIIKLNEIINNIYLEKDGSLEKSVTFKNHIIYPEKGKVLRNKKTLQIIDGYVSIGSRDSIDNYEEIAIEE